MGWLKDRLNARRVQKQAQAVLERVTPEIESLAPAGTQIKLDLCLEKIVELIDRGKGVESAAVIFTSLINHNREEFIGGLDQVWSRQAKEAYEAVETELCRQVPDGVTLDRQACLDRLIALTKEGVAPEELGSSLIASVERDPDKYLPGMDTVWSNRATEIYGKIEKDLRAEIPQGTTPNRQACIGLLASLQKAGHGSDDLLEKFSDAISHRPELYLSGMDTVWSEQAGQMYDQIEEGLRSRLPKGVTPLRDDCVRLLIRLMKNHTKPEEFMVKFFEVLKLNPAEYLKAPPGIEFAGSSAPYSSDEDQAMAGRIDYS